MMKVKRIGSVQVSPDGRQVVFTVRQAVMEGDKSEYRTHLHLANADGSHASQLTQGDKSCDDPQWSPDGQWIAFVSSRSGKKNLWLIRPNGGEARQLSDVTTGVRNFKWSPSGQWLAFTALDPATPEAKTAATVKNDVRVVDEHVKMSRLYIIPFTAPPKMQSEARLLTKGNFSVAGDVNRGARGLRLVTRQQDDRVFAQAHAEPGRLGQCRPVAGRCRRRHDPAAGSDPGGGVFPTLFPER